MPAGVGLEFTIALAIGTLIVAAIALWRHRRDLQR